MDDTQNKDFKPFASHPEALTAIKFVAWQELSGDEDVVGHGSLSPWGASQSLIACVEETLGIASFGTICPSEEARERTPSLM